MSTSFSLSLSSPPPLSLSHSLSPSFPSLSASHMPIDPQIGSFEQSVSYILDIAERLWPHSSDINSVASGSDVNQQTT